MEKKLVNVMIFGLALASLTTHWLNSKTGAPVQTMQSAKQARPTTSPTSAKKESLAPKKRSEKMNLSQKPSSAIEKSWLALSGTLYEPNQNFNAQEQRLREQLNQATHSELSSLSKAVLNPQESQDRRTAAAYMLNLAGPSVIPLLTEIAAAKLPGFADENFETALRSGALERLDLWALSGQKVKGSMELILKNQSNPTLKLFARVSLEGILEKRPGKLLRLSQKTLESY